MSLTHPNHAVTEQRLSEFYQAIMPYLNGEPQKIVYGIRIDNSESVPSAKVTYLEDAVGMTPAYMNFSTGKFDYGSWEEAFFMPKPCMLKYDGTVDYYLDPNDYTKKEDGVTASDVANTSYGGNAMMEWPKIWLKIVPDATASNKSADIYIANYKADADYTCWPFYNANNEIKDHFYTPIYNGSVVNNVLRSLSGRSPSTSMSYSSEYTYATANNPSGKTGMWTTETFSANQLISFLVILIAKSTNSKAVFGQGLRSSSYTTGNLNTRGLFYGTNSSSAVKIFGMENWYGYFWRRYVGLLQAGGSRKIKMTYGQADGSTVTGYNFSFSNSGYLNAGVSSPTGSNGGYIKEMIFTDKGMFPYNISGTSTSYYCDGEFYATNGIAMRGGGWDCESRIGIFCESIDTDGSYSNRGANIQCTPI